MSALDDTLENATIIPPLPCYSLTNGNDVALVFPFEKATPAPAVLWAKKVDLMKLSHYFEAMFTGGYSENDNILTETCAVLQACQNDLNRVVAEEEVKGRCTSPASSDSDVEDDEATELGAMDTESTEYVTASSSSPIHYIPIHDYAYKTYEGLLKWALTGKIKFAPLKSTHPTSPSSDPSAKSVYKLAHQLGVKELEGIAAANFKSQLSHVNVLEELFSSTCFAYPVLRDAGMKVLEREWGKVKKSGGLDSIFKLVESDQGDTKEMMKVALEILKRSQTLGS
jgi:Zn finger protein HypA/HybF involved in hydrogenase expression